MLGTGAAVLGGSLAYIAYRKVGIDYVGGVIKSGTSLQTIITSENLDYGKKFYAAFTKSDKELYKKTLPYFKGLEYEGAVEVGVKPLYNAESIVSKSIKYPSNKTAEKIYKQLVKDDSDFKKLVKSTPYSKFNENMVGNTQEAQQMFYDKLKKMGYSAIIDTNDQRGGGIGSDKPVIIFDTSNIVRGGIEKMNELDGKTIQDIKREGRKALEKNRFMKNSVPLMTAQVGGASIVIGGAANLTSNRQQKQRVERKG